MSKLIPWLRDRYLSIDRRLLGTFRILFGVVLLVDVLRRFPVVDLFFSNDGVLSNHFALFAPMATPYFSIYSAFSTSAEVYVAFAVTALCYCCYIVGYRTKLFQVLALLFVSSLNSRNLFLENGGSVTMCVIAGWTMFLPLGDRFSIDALRRSWRSHPAGTPEALNARAWLTELRLPVYSIAVLAILLQIAAIYVFNVLHKDGETWKNGEAIHWVLWQNRIATHLADWVRMHEPSWLSPSLVIFTFIVEAASPLLVLAPIGQKYTRSLNFLLTFALHAGIALLLTIGPFSYAMICLNYLALSRHPFDWFAERLKRRRPQVQVAYAPEVPADNFVARLLARLDPLERLEFEAAATTAQQDSASEAAAPSFRARSKGDAEWVSGNRAWQLATSALPLPGVTRLFVGLGLGFRFFEDREQRARRERFWNLQAVGELPPETTTPLQNALYQVRDYAANSLCILMMVAAGWTAMHANRAVPQAWRVPRPIFFRNLAEYPRMLQGWRMFAPEAPLTDGLIVVDGVTADGRHIDPLNGGEPDFEAPLHGPWFQTQFECDYHLKLHFNWGRRYQDEFKKYLQRWHTLVGRPEDRLVRFSVYWVENKAPAPGQTVPYDITKTLMFSGTQR